MKLATFSVPTRIGTVERLGVLQEGDVIVDVNAAYRHWLATEGKTGRCVEVADCLLPPNVLGFMRGAQMSHDALQTAVGHAHRLLNEGQAAVGPAEEALVHEISTVRLHAPLRPVTLREFSLCVGHQGRRGTRALPSVYYEIPTYWMGNTNSVIGPDDPIPWPSFTERLDYELEIAAVIGKRGINVSADRAYDYIAGFTIFNDVSTRDMQEREKPMGHGPAKSKGFCNVLGPCLVTSDETDGLNLSAFVRINGKQVAEGRNDDMVFNWAQVVEHISRDETIFPGDVLCSGVVTGCSGIERLNWAKSGPILNPGDLVELGVAEIGILRNRVAERAQTPR